MIVCGSRDWEDRETIYKTLAEFPKDWTVIHGDCRGADRIAGAAAIHLGMTVEIYPAQWKIFGRKAGPIRNRQMLDEGKPDMVLAFHHDYKSSSGTKNMIKQASEQGLNTVLVD
jgi:hypothetical protein